MAAEQNNTTAAPPAETSAAPVVAEGHAEGHAKASDEKPTKEKPVEARPSTPDTPLTKLDSRLDDICHIVGHREMWGVQLQNLDHVPTKVVLQKFLRANNDNPVTAEKQLYNALKWRKNMNPTALINKTFNKKKFDDLGFVTVHKDESGKETVITWNIYGAVKSNKATFGNVQEFVKWRAAIMELSVQKLRLDQVTEPIPEGGEDPYQMIQVHDYQNVSFFRMDPAVKAASKETITIFSMAYPELLSQKYFVNVPAIMGWMFGAMKLFLAPATLRKFHPMTSGTSLAVELKDIASTLPKEYGGRGPSVKEGLKIALAHEAEDREADDLTNAPVAETTLAEASLIVQPGSILEHADTTDSTFAAEPASAPTAAPVAAPVEAAKEETAEKATQTTDEKPVEEPLEKLTLKHIDETPEASKETAPTSETEKETAPTSGTEKVTAPTSGTEKVTAPSAAIEKEVTPAVESEKEPVPVFDAEKKETAV